MRHSLAIAMLGASIALGACSGDPCEDMDGDGYGDGAGCEAADCNDADPRHYTDCLSCSDPDDDGYGVGCNLGLDCAPSNGKHWADCGACTDGDLDGRGAGCDLGADCDDTDPDQFAACGACTDADGDGHFTGCDAYVNRPGPDCNDGDPDNWLRCDQCTDNDGDTRYAACDRYTTHQGPDCNDADPNNWTTCTTCRDQDGDGRLTGCDSYLGIMGPDCNDANPLHWADCGTCTDLDGDGRGPGCDLGADCNANNRDVWTSCATCADVDGDLRWAGCDSYFTRLGPDCNDSDPNSWSSCATCVDYDNDTYWRGCDTYTVGKPGPDCNDFDGNNWTACATCRDNDTDTYFVGCNRYSTISGPDCSDADRNNWTSCGTCVDTDGDLRFAGCDAYATILGPDCNNADNRHWSDCGACVDTDGDGRGTMCDLGDDCNDASNLHWSDCATCTDVDGDGYGAGGGFCDLGNNDCDDTNSARHPGAADPTVNGIDENCNGIDGPGFVDNFDDGVYGPQWTLSSGDTMLQTTYRVSGTYGLNLGGGLGDVQSTTFDTSACTGGVVWRYNGKRGPEVPDGGENLVLSYWNGTTWVVTDTWLGQGVEDFTFVQRQSTISAIDARHAGMRIRFQTSSGSGTCCDDYFIDDVVVGCNADADGDGTADPFDCAPTDPDHWSDCATCVDGDVDDFGPGCNLGPDCNDGDPGINPRAADLTTDGIDQNCDGYDGPIFTQTYTATPAMSITDNTGAALGCAAFGAQSSQINIADTGTLFDVDVQLDITHPRGNDLDVWLHYTNGVSTACIQLTTDNGLGANFTNTLFTDEAATSITAGSSPFTGSYRPESVLSAVDGFTRTGTWTLYINDDQFGSTGTLNAWSLSISYY